MTHVSKRCWKVHEEFEKARWLVGGCCWSSDFSAPKALTVSMSGCALDSGDFPHRRPVEMKQSQVCCAMQQFGDQQISADLSRSQQISADLCHFVRPLISFVGVPRHINSSWLGNLLEMIWCFCPEDGFLTTFLMPGPQQHPDAEAAKTNK